MGAAEALSAEEAQEAHAELDAQALQVAALEWLLETCGVNRSKVRRLKVHSTRLLLPVLCPSGVRQAASSARGLQAAQRALPITQSLLCGAAAAAAAVAGQRQGCERNEEGV